MEKLDKLIDLHTHTNFSDGTKSPFQLVNYAKNMGLSAIAITDHDTVDGIDEAIKAGMEVGIEVVPGIEIDVEYETEIHLLGYYLDYTSKQLKDTLEMLNVNRMNRNIALVENLISLGFDLSMSDVLQEADGEVIGRLHIAKTMVTKGIVPKVDDAFKRFLGRGMPAYVEKQRLIPQKGIDIIKDAGGVPVLAHPMFIGLDFDELGDLIHELKLCGLMGIEVYYSTHTRQEVTNLLMIAEKYELIVTGGSDYHGGNKRDIEIGRGFGNLKVDYALLETLKNVAGRI